MTTETLSPPRTFPASAVETALRAELLASVASAAQMHGRDLPAAPAEQCAAAVQLDSLDVVGMLCKVEPILDFKLKDSLVKTGGYGSVNEAMDHLMPKIRAAWEKHVSKGKRK